MVSDDKAGVAERRQVDSSPRGVHRARQAKHSASWRGHPQISRMADRYVGHTPLQLHSVMWVHRVKGMPVRTPRFRIRRGDAHLMPTSRGTAEQRSKQACVGLQRWVLQPKRVSSRAASTSCAVDSCCARGVTVTVVCRLHLPYLQRRTRVHPHGPVLQNCDGANR